MKLYKTPDSAIRAREEAKLLEAEVARLEGQAAARGAVRGGLLERRDELLGEARSARRLLPGLQVREVFASVSERIGAAASSAAGQAARFFAGLADRASPTAQVTTLDVERDPSAQRTSERLRAEIGAVRTGQAELTARAQKLWASAAEAASARDDLLTQAATHADAAAQLTRQARKDTRGATLQMYADHAAAGLGAIAERFVGATDTVKQGLRDLKRSMFSGFKQAAFKLADHAARGEAAASRGLPKALSSLPPPNDALAASMARLPFPVLIAAPETTPAGPEGLRRLVALPAPAPSADPIRLGQPLRAAEPVPFAEPLRLADPVWVGPAPTGAGILKPMDVRGGHLAAQAAPTRLAAPRTLDLRTLYTMGQPTKPVHWAAFAAGLDYSRYGEGRGKLRQRELEDALQALRRSGVEVLEHKNRAPREVKRQLEKRYGLKEGADFGALRDEWFKRQLVGLSGLAPREKLERALASHGLSADASVIALMEAPALRQARAGLPA